MSDFEDEQFRYECDDKVCTIENTNDFRKTKNLYNFKELIKDRLIFTTAFLQYTKKIYCSNFLIKNCSYVYDQNFLKSSWINEFDLNIQNNKNYKKSLSKILLYLDKIYYLSKEYNFDFSLAIYPWPGHILYPKNIDKYINYWKNYCNYKCKYFINHFEDFEKIGLSMDRDEIVKEFYIYGDMHFNKKGNKILAERLNKVF